MFRHILRRLIQSVPTLFGVTLLSYMIMAAAPGGPAKLLAFNTNPENFNEVTHARELERLGLNDPWTVQYLIWLTGNDWMHQIGLKNLDMDGKNDGPDRALLRYGILRGDFGDSFKYKQDVWNLITIKVPATLELGVASLIVSLAIGVPIGILAAIWRGGKFDNATRVMAVVGSAIPTFWFGLMLLTFFGLTLHLEWARGQQCDLNKYMRGCPPIFMRLEYLIMPTIVLSYGGVAGYSRYMRTAMLDTINSDYIRTARAKGLTPRSVWFKHAARNAMIPLATFLGPALVGVLGGAPISEQIFSWPGLGKFLLDAVSGRDYPVVMASVVISAVLTVIAYLISDIAYAVFDPRIRF
jgi:peptide/nickel transport system permease protein